MSNIRKKFNKENLRKSESIKQKEGENLPKEDIRRLERIKKGINYVFNQNKELRNIGTQEQYLEYLKTIFPDSLVEEIVYHGTDSFDNTNKRLSGFDNLDEGIFFTDNLKYAKSYAEYRGGETIIVAVLNIQNPARDENLEGLFGGMDEDPTLYEGFSGLKRYGFDGYISKSNFDTPDSEIYSEDPEYKAENERVEKLKKEAKHINLEDIDEDFVVDDNYAIHGDTHYLVTRFLDEHQIKHNCYSVDTLQGIAFVNNEESLRKNYQSVNYLVFNKAQIHILGNDSDIERFKKYIEKRTKNF